MDNEKAIHYLHDLMKVLMAREGSDLFITAGSAPAVKVNTEIQRIGARKLSQTETSVLVRAIMNDRQLTAFDRDHEANFSLNYPDIARFRISAFQQRGSAGMVLRLIKSHIPSFEELHLPPVLADIAMEKHGLVLFVGATGSGKSTSLAAMLDYRNEHSNEHIVTIEDPIEFFHAHKQCLVNQREVGMDTESYGIALKNTLRQAPNVILIGEIRDRETMEFGINFAETGHLCLSTLHANNADQAFDRIINFFPEDRRPQLLMDLAFNMRAIVSQRLIKRIDAEGLIPAVEVLMKTPIMEELIFNGRIHEIKSFMAKSDEQGIQTFDQCLFRLYEEGYISYESAMRYADSMNDLRIRIKLQSKRPRPKGLESQLDNMQIQEEAKGQHWPG